MNRKEKWRSKVDKLTLVLDSGTCCIIFFTLYFLLGQVDHHLRANPYLVCITSYTSPPPLLSFSPGPTIQTFHYFSFSNCMQIGVLQNAQQFTPYQAYQFKRELVRI